METDNAEIIRVANAARSVLKNLKPLEQLCIEAVLRAKKFKHQFDQLPHAVMDSIVKELLGEMKGMSTREASRFVILVDGLMNPNLRTFSCRMMNIFDAKSYRKQWDQLTGTCHKLRTLYSEDYTMSRLIAMDLKFFPNLQRLSILNFELRCPQLDAMPKLVPNLRVLEFKVDFIKGCCLNALCLLTGLEQLAFKLHPDPNFYENDGVLINLMTRRYQQKRYREFMHSSISTNHLLATFLEKLPRLKVLSEEPLKENKLPDLYAAFKILQLKGHKEEFKLTHLLFVDRQEDNTMVLQLIYQLKCITTLHVQNSELTGLSRNTISLIHHFGHNLTHFKLSSIYGEIDVNMLARACPLLEELVLKCGVVPNDKSRDELPRGYFTKLRRFKKQGGLDDLHASFLQCVMESPKLQEISLSSHGVINNQNLMLAIAGAISYTKESAFKNLRKFKVKPTIAGGQCDFLVAMRVLIASAPRLELLYIKAGIYFEVIVFKNELERVCDLVPGLKLAIDSYQSWSSDEN